MSDNSAQRYQHRILTIPNVLSFFRLCLIPLIVWLYCAKKSYIGTTLLLLLSGITDVADGMIARRCHMVSDFGKAFDPIADKLTQIAMLFCLVSRFPYMLIPLTLLTVKEIFAAVTGLLTIKKTGEVMGAKWHGKVTTVLLYSMMLIHLLWFGIPRGVSLALVGICTAMMLLSAILYGIRNIRALIRRA